MRGGPTKKKNTGRVFFFAPCAAGRPKKTRGAFFFLLCARRGKFTHSLARPRLCVVFFVVCAAREIHSLTCASGGAFFFFAVCAAVDIHSLTGASGGDSLTHWRVRGRVFFFAPCAAGEIHSLTGASAAVCGWNRGRVFFLLRARRGKFTPSLARLRLCVVEKAGAFFFAPCAARGNSLTHWRIRGRVFFLFCARRWKFTHSLARPRLCVVFFCCLRGGGNSLTHSRVRGRFFFVCCVRGGGHSLTHWRVRG